MYKRELYVSHGRLNNRAMLFRTYRGSAAPGEKKQHENLIYALLHSPVVLVVVAIDRATLHNPVARRVTAHEVGVF